jgi:hypothetical protein
MLKTGIRSMLAVSLAATALAGCGTSAGDQEQTSAEASAAPCDRDCLLQATDTYLAALAEHDPAKAPLAADAKFVENLKRLKVGEGLWQTTTAGKTAFAISVPDPQLQQAGWLGMIEQSGKPVLLALRLKFDNGKIVEAEHLVGPPAQGKMDNLRTVRAGLLQEIPQDQRLDHDQLIRIGADYYDALDDNDGSKAPFAADCERHENGMITAGANAGPPPNWKPGQPRTSSDCAKQLDSKTFTYIDKIENRRLIAADPVTGLVMGFSHFRHPMTNLPYDVINTDGSTTERNKENMPYDPFDFPAAHIFKVGPDAKIHEIEASGITTKFNSPTGWE